jgi:LuxR family transcriptional regulator, maltose regulon positive regulatory protein
MKQVLQSLLGTPPEQASSLPAPSLAFVRKLLAAFSERLEARDLRLADLLPVSGRGALWAPQASPLLEPLTPREQEVLGLLMAAASNQEIAAQLVISVATVKKHVSNLLGKLGVENRTQVIAYAREWSALA